MLPTVKGTTQTALTCCLWPWQGLLSQQRSPCFIFSLISPLSSSLRRRARARSILGFRQLPKQSCSLPFQASSYGNRSRVGAFGTEHRGIEYNSRAQVHSDNSGVPVDKEATLTPSRIDAQPFASRRPTIVQLRRSECSSLGLTWPCVNILVCVIGAFCFSFALKYGRTCVCVRARTNTHTCVPYACNSDAKWLNLPELHERDQIGIQRRMYSALAPPNFHIGP